MSKSKIEQYPKYDNSQLIAAPGSADILLKPGKPVCDITMQLHQKILTTKRKYTTLLEVLGDVGGLMELIYSFFNLICSFITDIMYEKSLINNLFSFDIDKKVINLKHNKKIGINKYLTNSMQNLIKIDSFKDKNPISDLKKDNIEVYNKERDYIKITRGIRKMSTRSKIKANNSTKMLKNSNNDKYNLNSNDINNLEQNSNDLYINSKYLRNDSNENRKNTEIKIESIDNDSTIVKIKLNPLILCCLNKKRNMEKLLFEEGNKLISINLDIMNMFEKSYLVEKIQKNINIEGNIIEMDDKLKRRIEQIRNYYSLSS